MHSTKSAYRGGVVVAGTGISSNLCVLQLRCLPMIICTYMLAIDLVEHSTQVFLLKQSSIFNYFYNVILAYFRGLIIDVAKTKLTNQVCTSRK
jgi:hypothetical protein